MGSGEPGRGTEEDGQRERVNWSNDGTVYGTKSIASASLFYAWSIWRRGVFELLVTQA